MATIVAEATKRIERAEREARRQKIADEAARLGREREAKANAARAARLEAERKQRVAAAIAAGAVCEFTVNDTDRSMVYRIRVAYGHEDAAARGTARAAIVALSHGITRLEADRISTSNYTEPAIDVAKHLAMILEGPECSQATRFGLLTAEQKAK